MQFLSTLLFSLPLLASVASAERFSVVVGNNNANTFEPTSLSGVKEGDTISFKFVSKNHTLTQSTFATPCIKKPDGVDSGFVPVAAGATTFPEWTISINNVSAPLWFYCAQGQHCAASGMVFAINPPATGDRTFEAFLALAKGQTAPTTGTAAGGTTGATTGGTTGGTTTTDSTSTTGGAGGVAVVNGTDTDANGTPGSSNADSGAFSISARKASLLLAMTGVFFGLAA